MSGEASGKTGESAGLPDLPRELPARRGFSVFYRGKTLLSRIDPVARGERLAAEISVKERTLYFCPSPLYGYGLSLLLEKLPENSAVLCVEADENLFEISRKALGGLFFGESEFRPLALVKAADAETLCAFAGKTWGERRFRRVETLRFGGGWQLFPRLYEDFAGALRRSLAVEWGNALTLIRLGRLYARNLIRNLALLSESGNTASLDFGLSPVLVLGAGPSLDSALDELAALSGGKIPAPEQRRFKIVCVDTCLPALHERRILPDLAVILESQHWNLRDFSGARGRKVDAAVDLSALPASGRTLGGRRFFFATPWTELSLFGRLREAGLLPETLPPLGSVGLSAVAIALARTKGTVITAGIDFSFTPDAYHARSTPGYEDLRRTQNRFRSLVNAGAAFRDGCFAALSKTGNPVRSDPAMRTYRDLFEQEFGGNPRLFDMESSGLPLGVKTVTLEEAFAILNSGEAAAPIQSRPGVISTPAAFQPEAAPAFIRREKAALVSLRGILKGESPAVPGRLEELLDYADYLWAHFPDCAGAGGRRPPCTDTGFLKRVRAEIDGFLECWEMADETRR